MKRVRLALSVALFLLTVFISGVVYLVECEIRVLKEDYIELSKAKYGIFNVDEWKNTLADIVSVKIREFDLSNTDRADLKVKVSGLLYELLDEFEGRYKESNSKSISGFFKNTTASFLGVFESMRRDIPKFTEQILDFLESPDNREGLRAYLLDKLDNYAQSTFAEMDYSIHDDIIDLYGCGDREETLRHLKTSIQTKKDRERPWSYSLFGVFVLTWLAFIFIKRPEKHMFIMAILSSLVLLGCGLLLPMIDIDARISHVAFTFLGEPLAFTDQVLYYKSKSILEVVRLMFSQGKPDIVLVGIMVLTFSVLFPVSKSLASLAYIAGDRVRNSRVIRFLLFKSGKWSMADVMVVAIFMAYIGFTGILSEQLSQIEDIAQRVSILTTNQSQLQVGFFFFAAFVLMSLVISHRLEYPAREDVT